MKARDLIVSSDRTIDEGDVKGAFIGRGNLSEGGDLQKVEEIHEAVFFVCELKLATLTSGEVEDANPGAVRLDAKVFHCALASVKWLP